MYVTHYFISLSVTKKKVKLLWSLGRRRCHHAKTVMLPITQKVLKISTPTLEYLLIMTRCSCKTKGIKLKAIVLKLWPFLTKDFKWNDGPWQMSVGTACGALVVSGCYHVTDIMICLSLQISFIMYSTCFIIELFNKKINKL